MKAKVTISFNVELQRSMSIKEMESSYLPLLDASTSASVIFDREKANVKVEAMELLSNE